MSSVQSAVNNATAKRVTHCLSGIKAWEAKFIVIRGSQDSEETGVTHRRRGGGRPGKHILVLEAKRVTCQKWENTGITILNKQSNP